MNSDMSSLEAQLRELRAAPLDDAYLARLEDAADGLLTKLLPADDHFEARLRSTSPAPLPADYFDTLLAAVGDTPFRSEEKILRFPAPRLAPIKRRQRPWWGAAAAVALAGAATALLMPAGKSPSVPLAENRSTPATTISPSPAITSHLVPAGFNRGVSEVRDEGVIWKSDSEPQNLVRVVFMDQITLRDNQGRTYQVEQPRVEYMLVPAKTD